MPKKRHLTVCRSGGGGKRNGSGRKKRGNGHIFLTLKPATIAKLERMRKGRSKSETIDALVKNAKCEGEREIYQLAAEISG
jgi:hypothetical protein